MLYKEHPRVRYSCVTKSWITGGCEIGLIIGRGERGLIHFCLEVVITFITEFVHEGTTTASG